MACSDRSKFIEYCLFFIGIFMCVSELWKQYTLTFRINGGYYDWWYFPFQLCSIPMYLLVFFPVFRRSHIKSVFFTFLMDYSLLGGICVFLDTSGMYYPLASLTVHSWLWHILIIIAGILCGIFAVRYAVFFLLYHCYFFKPYNREKGTHQYVLHQSLLRDVTGDHCRHYQTIRKQCTDFLLYCRHYSWCGYLPSFLASISFENL
mgnify:CR=1 FL=1